VARINIVNVKILNSDTLDVRITCLESGNEYSKTNVCKNINSKWNQVFYIPIYDIHKKLKIRVYDISFFKSVSLGSYIFNPKNFIEGKKLDLERDLIKPKNRTLRIPPRPNKGNLHFDADFYSFSNHGFTTKTTKFSKTIIFFYSLCNLIAYQSQDDGFKLDKLVNLFNFNSKDELMKTFTDTINDDEKVKTLTIDNNVLIAGNLKYFKIIIILLIT
jgi:Ca2+-dependent lipid-binding protein